METETVFRIILSIVIISFIAHRGYYHKKHSSSEENTIKQQKESRGDRLTGVALGTLGLGLTSIYALNPIWVAWASLPLPIWLRWTGVGITVLGFILLQWSQNTLGKNWSGTPRMIKDQIPVTRGPYHLVRHPIYAAFLLILGATLLISANWAIGLFWIGMITFDISSRIDFEEALMLEYFGDQYREYMKRTGRLFPKLI